MPTRPLRSSRFLPRLLLLVPLLSASASAACTRATATAGSPSNGASAAATATAPVTVASSSTTTPGNPLSAEDTARAVVMLWNDALDKHDLDKLTKVYAPRVKLYGSELSRAKVIEAKKRAFTEDPTFKQEIVLPITVTKVDDTYVVTFTKRSGGTKESIVQARVVVVDGLVSEESDASTDKRATEPAVVGSDPCEAAIREAALTIPACKTAIDASRNSATKGGRFYEVGSPSLHHVEKASYVHEWQFSPSPSSPTHIAASAEYTEADELTVSCEYKDAVVVAATKAKVKAACTGYFDRARRNMR